MKIVVAVVIGSLVPICLPDITVCDQISQASPLCICILEAMDRLA